MFENHGGIWSVDMIDNALQAHFSRKVEGEEDPPPVPFLISISSFKKHDHDGYNFTCIPECFHTLFFLFRVDVVLHGHIPFVQVKTGLCHAQASALKGLAPNSIFQWSAC